MFCFNIPDTMSSTPYCLLISYQTSQLDILGNRTLDAYYHSKKKIIGLNYVFLIIFLFKNTVILCSYLRYNGIAINNSGMVTPSKNRRIAFLGPRKVFGFSQSRLNLYVGPFNGSSSEWMVSMFTFVWT